MRLTRGNCTHGRYATGGKIKRTEMTDREKVFFILGYAKGDIETLVTLVALADIRLSAILDECAKECEAFKLEMKSKTEYK